MKRHVYPPQPTNGITARYCTYCHLGEWFVGDTECQAAPDSPEPPVVAKEPARIFTLVPKPAPVPPPAAPEWSPLGLLEEFIAEIKSGKIVPTSLLVSFMVREPNGNVRPHSWRANVSHAEAIAYAQLEIQKAIEDWRQP